MGISPSKNEVESLFHLSSFVDHDSFRDGVSGVLQLVKSGGLSYAGTFKRGEDHTGKPAIIFDGTPEKQAVKITGGKKEFFSVSQLAGYVMSEVNFQFGCINIDAHPLGEQPLPNQGEQTVAEVIEVGRDSLVAFSPMPLDLAALTESVRS